MGSRGGIPDAWDDDYEAVADSKVYTLPTPAPAPSRSQRKARHAAANKALWESAEDPEAHTPYFLQTKADVPLKDQVKPQVQVLSRKPKPEKPAPTPAPREPGDVSGLETDVNGLSLQGQQDDELDSEDEARLEEEKRLKRRQEQARVEREEKVKKYDETRRRIFGDAQGSPDTTPNGRDSSKTSPNGRQRGSARGGRGNNSRTNSRPASSAGQSPARPPTQGQKQLYDPDYTSKPGPSFIQKDSIQNRPEMHPVRQPRGPDGSGRGGFGFTARSNLGSDT